MPDDGNSPGRSDAELLAEVRLRRSGHGFDALYRRHRRRLFGLCLHYLDSPAEAEDAVHEAFVKAWEQIGTLRGDNFGAWIGRIATNLCLNRLRARRPQEPVGESLQDDAMAQPEARAMGAELGRRARAVLAALGPEQRQALELKYVQGCSYDEICRLTGCGFDQVRSHLQNGRRNFRRLWERDAAAGGEKT